METNDGPTTACVSGTRNDHDNDDDNDDDTATIADDMQHWELLNTINRQLEMHVKRATDIDPNTLKQ